MMSYQAVVRISYLVGRGSFRQKWMGGATAVKYMQQKKVGWEVIFSELRFAGSRARKPRQEFKGNALELFFHVVSRLDWALIV